MTEMVLVTDGEGGTLFVHPVCGATIWWGPESPSTEEAKPTPAAAGKRCDVCDPDHRHEPDGTWTRVWVQAPLTRRRIKP